MITCVQNLGSLTHSLFPRIMCKKWKTLQHHSNLAKNSTKKKTIFNLFFNNLFIPFAYLSILIAKADLCNRKSIETRGYLIYTRGRCPEFTPPSIIILIRLPSVLMFFLFCVIVKHKNTFPDTTI
jgi:hypothetical protein